MSGEVIIPALAGILAAVTATWIKAWLDRDKDEADSEDNRANALEKYWNRIRDLEAEKDQMHSKMAAMEAAHLAETQRWQAERQRLWAEIGQLRSEMVHLKQNGGLK